MGVHTHYQETPAACALARQAYRLAADAQKRVWAALPLRHQANRFDHQTGRNAHALTAQNPGVAQTHHSAVQVDEGSARESRVRLRVAAKIALEPLALPPHASSHADRAAHRTDHAV